MQKRQKRDEEVEGDDAIDADSSALKRTKYDAPSSSALVTVSDKDWAVSTSVIDPSRTSSLPAPEVSLVGHEGAVYSISFDPTGNHLCSGSLDKNILLWDVHGKCSNYNVMTGHKGAVLELHWCERGSIVSCSADKTVATWDANKGLRTRKFAEHTGIVNSCSVARDAPHLIASGSDDCTVVLWDARVKKSLSSIYHDYQVCSVCLSHDGTSVFTGGIDNIIRRFDARRADVEMPDMELEAHADTITGLALSPDGHHLLSNSMDSQLRCWDVRPFVAGGPDSAAQRCEHVLTGVHHGAEKLLLRCAWAPDQDTVTAGSADRLVHMWETTTYQQLPSWPGHKASVNEVIFHPTERIVASCSSDKTIILGELPAL